MIFENVTRAGGPQISNGKADLFLAGLTVEGGVCVCGQPAGFHLNNNSCYIPDLENFSREINVVHIEVKAIWRDFQIEVGWFLAEQVCSKLVT